MTCKDPVLQLAFGIDALSGHVENVRLRHKCRSRAEKYEAGIALEGVMWVEWCVQVCRRIVDEVV
jgi:hypothetical protein